MFINYTYVCIYSYFIIYTHILITCIHSVSYYIFITLKLIFKIEMLMNEMLIKSGSRINFSEISILKYYISWVATNNCQNDGFQIVTCLFDVNAWVCCQLEYNTAVKTAESDWKVYILIVPPTTFVT